MALGSTSGRPKPLVTEAPFDANVYSFAASERGHLTLKGTNNQSPDKRDDIIIQDLEVSSEQKVRKAFLEKSLSSVDQRSSRRKQQQDPQVIKT